MAVRYCPMLKTKAGEAAALEQLMPATRQAIMPVLHTTTSVANSFIQKISQGWGVGRVAVDGEFCFNETNSVQTFNSLIRSLRSLNVDAIPSIAVSSDPRLVQAAISHLGMSGLVVQCQIDELPFVNGFLARNGINPLATDLFVVVGDVSLLPINALAGVIASSLSLHVGAQHPYRSVTIAAAAAPKDHGA